MKSFLLFFSFAIAILMLTRCSQQVVLGVQIPQAHQPFEKLSDYQFFAGPLADLQPTNNVLPYDLNSPLFSDYAHKARFVWMPEGKSANYTTDHVLDFPEGAVLIKNFYYQNDENEVAKGKRIMETRLLINRATEWEAIGYIWNEEQTEAYYEVVGDIKEVNWTNEQGKAQFVNYIIPNKNQCKGCHAYDGQQKPIGPKVRNLNKSFAYADGEMNQLKKWASVGYLKGYDTQKNHPKVAVWDDLSSGDTHERAMAYLDINCGHCHNKKGAANTSGLHLVADNELDMTMGVYKATVSAGAGTGGFQYSIVPNHPEESIMVYRMNSTNPGAMMPEVGRRMVHTEGVALISDWIKNMEFEGERPLN
ncbi:MAG: SO2930 family diheme c-type cytochrome [Bacteroidota bacterium]